MAFVASRGVQTARPVQGPLRTRPLAPLRRLHCRAAQVSEVVESTELSWTPGQVCYMSAAHHETLLEHSHSRLVVIDVFTTWCGPCKLIAPELEKIAEEHGEKLVMAKIDCTTLPENKKWAMSHNVKALPTFLLFKDGKRVNDMTGAKAANLRKLIEAHL